MKGLKRGVEKGLKIPKEKISLGLAEQEILHLVTDEFLTVKQIALRRQTSLTAVYKVLNKLRKKGVLTVTNEGVEKSQGTHSPIRLHGQEFNIRILWQDQKYQAKLRQSNIIFFDSNTIKLYRNSVEIFCGQSFFGKDEREADSKSMAYFTRFLRRLENELQIILLKNRSLNIKEVKHEFAHTNSEIYQNAKDHKERIFVYAEEDGRLAFITDNSFKFNEDETVHPQTAKPDRKAIDKQVNDWRLHDPPTNSELAQISKGIQENQLLFAENISTHIKAIQDLGAGVTKLTALIEDLERKKQDK